MENETNVCSMRLFESRNHQWLGLAVDKHIREKTFSRDEIAIGECPKPDLEKLLQKYIYIFRRLDHFNGSCLK